MAIEVSSSSTRRFKGKDLQRMRIDASAIVTWEFKEDTQQIFKIQEENRRSFSNSSSGNRLKIEEQQLYWVQITLTNGKEMNLGRTSRENALAIVRIIDREKRHQEREMDIFTEAQFSLRGKELSKKTGIT